MITMGASFIKKLTVLVAVLLCSLLILALPVVSQAASTDEVTTISPGDVSDDISFALTPGEISSGDPEAVLQLDKTAFSQAFKEILQQFYPKQSNTPAVPAFYTFSKKDCSLNSIHTKGP